MASIATWSVVLPGARTRPASGVTWNQSGVLEIRTARPDRTNGVLNAIVSPSFRVAFWIPTVAPLANPAMDRYWNTIAPLG